MPTTALDHVNILTDDLAATIAFYETVVELKAGESPGAAYGYKGAWMLDPAGHALVHLVWNDPEKALGAGRQPGASTNAVHHIAFSCTGFAAAKERLDGLGIEHRINDGMLGLRQIMAEDPNGVTIEMNFHGD